jgi:Fe-S-cluster-containing hydrogenase component 2
MPRRPRKIIVIDEEKCDGCGLCASACAEGAIAMVEGKARLISETYCDGLGACIGECPRGAITIVEREAEAFDDAAVAAHLHPAAAPSRLRTWPVQIHLVPVRAPFLKGAHLTIAADCAAVAYPDFHARFLADRVVMIGCPKLDDAAAYREKLTAIFRENEIREVEVAIMEVPCCGGLARLVAGAIADSGRAIPLRLTRVGVRGELESLTPVAR